MGIYCFFNSEFKCLLMTFEQCKSREALPRICLLSQYLSSILTSTVDSHHSTPYSPLTSGPLF